MATLTRIALAATVALACQHNVSGRHVGKPSSPTAKPKPRATYVAVSQFETATIVAEPVLSELNAAVQALPPGDYVVSLSAVDSYGVVHVTAPASTDVSIELSSACVKVEGDVSSSRLVFYPWHAPQDLVIVPVDERGHFEACLPAERFAVSVIGSPGESLDQIVDVVEDMPPVHLTAWSKANLDQAMPAHGAFPTKTIRELAETIPATAKVIGIGESDHGSRTALAARASLLKGLMDRNRLSAIALEIGAVEAYAIDDYVQGRSVDIRRAVANNGYWIWDTEEFLALLDVWKDYNAAHRESPVHVVGADQPQTAQAVDYVVAAAARLRLDAETVRLLGLLREKRAAAITEMSRESIGRILSALGDAIGSGEVDSFDSQSARDVFAAVSVRNRILASSKQGVYKNAQRDRAIAEMLASYAAVDRGRSVAFLGHNMHVMNLPDKSPPPAGAHLRQMLGSEYVSIGVFALDGETRAWDAELAVGVIPQRLEPSPKTAFAGALAAGTPAETICFWNRELPLVAREWLKVPRAVRGFGPTFVAGEEAYQHLPITTAVDAAILLRNVQPTTPTMTGVRKRDSGGP